MIDPQKIGQMMQQAQAMQQRMQDELQRARVEGQAGGGMVRVTLNGTYEVTELKIEPSVVNPAEVGLLEDLVRAAFHDATTRLEEVRVAQARTMASQLGMPPGMF